MRRVVGSLIALVFLTTVTAVGALDTWKLGPVVTNIGGTPGRYVRATIEVAAKPNLTKTFLERHRVALLGAAVAVLSAATAEDIYDAAKRAALKVRLLEGLNAELGEPVLMEIFFTELIVQ